MNRFSLVYVSAAWWSNGEPAFAIIAKTGWEAERAVRKFLNANRDPNLFNTIEDAMKCLKWSKPHIETLHEALDDNEALIEEALPELIHNHVWFPPR